MLTERQEQLFTDILEHYIKTSDPVGSKALAASKRWDVSSATLRNEMAALEREGLIMQPHTSAGRIPTEKGYQYYRSRYLKPDPIANVLDKALANSYQDTSEESLKNLARELANISELAVIIGLGNKTLYYTGLRNLLEQPEFESLEEMYDILEALEEHERDVMNLFETLEGEIAVLIGSENSLFPDGSFVATPIVHQNKRRYIGILGPMRMEYGKMVGLIKRCSHLIIE